MDISHRGWKPIGRLWRFMVVVSECILAEDLLEAWGSRVDLHDFGIGPARLCIIVERWDEDSRRNEAPRLKNFVDAGVSSFGRGKKE